MDCRIAIGKPVEPARSHQHRADRNTRIDFLVPVIDDAGLHQIGDPISDSSGMDTQSSLIRERAGHRLGNRAEADCVVTEHGIADLRGRTLAERARALIAITDPGFRAELERASDTLV